MAFLSVMNIAADPRFPAPPESSDARGHIDIVTAGAVASVDVWVWTTPENWVYPDISTPVKEAAAAGIAIFPSERYYWFEGNPEAPMDVLYLNGERQVIGILERVSGGIHGVCIPAQAVVFLPAGMVAQYHMRQGNLVVSPDDSITILPKPTTEDPAKALGSMIHRLKRSARLYEKAGVELGECYLENRMYGDAISLFEKQLQKKARTDAKVGLALALAGAGRLDESVQQLAAVIDSDDDSQEAYLHLTGIFRRMNNLEGTVTVLKAGLQKHPERLELRLELAKVYLQIGNLPAAAVVLENAPNTSVPDGAMISRVMGDVYLRQGRMVEAATAYQRYLAVYSSAPHAAELRLFIARHLARHSNDALKAEEGQYEAGDK